MVSKYKSDCNTIWWKFVNYFAFLFLSILKSATVSGIFYTKQHLYLYYTGTAVCHRSTKYNITKILIYLPRMI